MSNETPSNRRAGIVAEAPIVVSSTPRSGEIESEDALAMAMWRSLALRDELTAAHCSRVAKWVVLLAAAYGLSDEERWTLRRGAMLHDVGKLGVPDAVLNKPGRLHPHEREIINTHPDHGHALVSAVLPLPGLRDIVLFHHERWDGQGYPRGVAGEAIPFGARVLAVCDTYDAMTTHRPYRQGLGHDLALEEIARAAGTQFDPAVVDAFTRVVDGH